MNKKEFQASDLKEMMENYLLSDETIQTIESENLLPISLINRLHKSYPSYSGFDRKEKGFFTDRIYYTGISGFREIVKKLSDHGINIGHIADREFFIDVYRFLATKHTLNAINWKNYENDSLFQLIFPQPGMMPAEDVKKYVAAKTEEEKQKFVAEYQKKTNPHDGKQKLNKPWFINDDGHLEILPGSQHKYPPVKLIFDQTTQNCFAFCTYCFRHAQVRGDEDMFVQKEIRQVHEYLKRHKEVTDFLITGGDAGFITAERFEQYALPIIEDPELLHVRSIRFGSRAATFHPEHLLGERFKKVLEVCKKAVDSGIQVVWVAHISTPHDILNPATIAAFRRMKKYGLTIKSQSPIMNHISLFMDENGKTDVDRSAQNWIDLGNVLAMLGIGFHSMYCARPTGEHHYFTAPLADISKVFGKVFKELASINRPSRYITMTSSAGKISLLGTTEINGEKVFALKFNEGRNMDWMDTVYFAKYDEKENTIEKLKPYEGDRHFYEQELIEIENKLEEALKREIYKEEHHD